MKKVSEYKEHAEECRALARTSKSAEHREMLLNMAATWDALADSRLKSTASHGRVARIEGLESGDTA
jgi:hypothetical protein